MTTYTITQHGDKFHVNSLTLWAGAFLTRVDAEAWISRAHAEEESKAKAKRDKANAATRAKRQAMKDLGMVRVRGAMGGIYYE